MPATARPYAPLSTTETQTSFQPTYWIARVTDKSEKKRATDSSLGHPFVRHQSLQGRPGLQRLQRSKCLQRPRRRIPLPFEYYSFLPGRRRRTRRRSSRRKMRSVGPCRRHPESRSRQEIGSTNGDFATGTVAPELDVSWIGVTGVDHRVESRGLLPANPNLSSVYTVSGAAPTTDILRKRPRCRRDGLVSPPWV